MPRASARFRMVEQPRHRQHMWAGTDSRGQALSR
jgi:hypothetical protein